MISWTFLLIYLTNFVRFCGVIENRHSSCPLQEGEWPHQGEWQTPGDGGASHPPVQGEFGLPPDQHPSGLEPALLQDSPL